MFSRNILLTSLVFFLLSACGSGDSADDTDTNSTTAASIPNAPSILILQVEGDTQINLSWSDNSTDEDNFVVERKIGAGGTFGAIATLSADTTTHSDNGLSPGTTYYYRVMASNSAGDSDYCTEVSTTTTASVSVVPNIEIWSRAYTVVDNASAKSVRQTLDGGYIFAGTMDIEPPQPEIYADPDNYELWITKLNPDGSVDWSKTIGDYNGDSASDIIQTSDGGYVVTGNLDPSSDTNVLDMLWVLRLDSQGNQLWSKYYDRGRGEKIIQTADGGFAVAGTYVNNSTYGWVLKLDAQGDIEWERKIGIHNAGFTEIQQTPDLGYIVAGTRSSESSFEPTNIKEIWLVKFDPTGSTSWQKTMGDADDSFVNDLVLVDSNGDGLKDDGYVIVGYSDTDDTITADLIHLIDYRAWMIKVSSDGTTVDWQNYYGVTDHKLFGVEQTPDGGYIASGTTAHTNPTGNDAWLIKLDGTGSTIEWQKRYGDLANETAYEVQLTSDSGYILAAYPAIYPVSGYGPWIMKLDLTADITLSPFNSIVADTNETVIASNMLEGSTTDNPMTGLETLNGIDVSTTTETNVLSDITVTSH